MNARVDLLRVLRGSFAILLTNSSTPGEDVEDETLAKLLRVDRSDQLQRVVTEFSSVVLAALFGVGACLLAGAASARIRHTDLGGEAAQNTALAAGILFTACLLIAFWHGARAAVFVTLSLIPFAMLGVCLVGGGGATSEYPLGAFLVAISTGVLSALAFGKGPTREKSLAARLKREVLFAVVLVLTCVVPGVAFFALTQLFGDPDSLKYAIPIAVAWPHTLLALASITTRGVATERFTWSRLLGVPVFVPVLLATILVFADDKARVVNNEVMHRAGFGYLAASAALLSGLFAIWYSTAEGTNEGAPTGWKEQLGPRVVAMWRGAAPLLVVVVIVLLLPANRVGRLGFAAALLVLGTLTGWIVGALDQKKRGRWGSVLLGFSAILALCVVVRAFAGGVLPQL